MAVAEDADEEDEEEVVNPLEVSYWVLKVLPAVSFTPVVTLVL